MLLFIKRVNFVYSIFIINTKTKHADMGSPILILIEHRILLIIE